MAQFLRSGGSMRRRARTSDIATLQVAEKRKWKTAQRTLEALDQFEEGLIAQQEAAAKVIEDLPVEADAANHDRRFTNHGHGNGDGLEYAGHGHGGGRSRRSCAAEPKVLQGHLEDPAHCRRPPSPLAFYDYGAISLKPKSMFSQNRAFSESALSRSGGSASPGGKRRMQNPNGGVYFPGPHYKHGGYGFSVAEPVLLPPRCWEKGKEPGLRWRGDPHDMRPLASEEHGLRHTLSGSPSSPSSIKATTSHAMRAERSFHCLDRRREESLLEQAYFEQGVSRARWRDPLLDSPNLPEPPAEEYGWLMLPAAEMSPVQQTAASLLFRLEHVARRSRGRLAQLFVDQQAGHPGILEADEFLRGLIKNNVVEANEFTPQRVIKVMSTVDPAFDGRVTLPRLARAVSAARGARVQQEKAVHDAKTQRQVKLNTTYSESIPVDVIKVDRYESSLLNFNRSFQKFVIQQKGLLDHHNEASAGNDPP